MKKKVLPVIKDNETVFSLIKVSLFFFLLVIFLCCSTINGKDENKHPVNSFVAYNRLSIIRFMFKLYKTENHFYGFKKIKDNEKLDLNGFNQY